MEPLKAPIAAPTAIPSNGTKKINPKRRPQKLPPSAPPLVSLCSCSVFGFFFALRPVDVGGVVDLDQFLLLHPLQQREGVPGAARRIERHTVKVAIPAPQVRRSTSRTGVFEGTSSNASPVENDPRRRAGTRNGRTAELIQQG
jgi:hypothetical protein